METRTLSSPIHTKQSEILTTLILTIFVDNAHCFAFISNLLHKLFYIGFSHAFGQKILIEILKRKILMDKTLVETLYI